MNQSSSSYSHLSSPASRIPTSNDGNVSPNSSSNYTRSLPLYNKNIQEEPTFIPRDELIGSDGKPYKTRERLYFEPEDDQDDQENSLGTMGNDNKPPKTSIYDFALTPERKYQKSKPLSYMDSINMPRNFPFIPSNSLLPSSMAAISNVNDEDDEDDCWITIFGFHPSASDQILQYFCNLGSVTNHEMGQGNWYHVQYSSKWSAQKALCKNGIIIPFSSLSMMIGVLPTKLAMNQIDQSASKLMSPLSSRRRIEKSDEMIKESKRSFINETDRIDPPFITDNNQRNDTSFSFKKPLFNESSSSNVINSMETPLKRNIDTNRYNYPDDNFPIDSATPLMRGSSLSSSFISKANISDTNYGMDDSNTAAIARQDNRRDRGEEGEREGNVMEKLITYIIGW